MIGRARRDARHRLQGRQARRRSPVAGRDEDRAAGLRAAGVEYRSPYALRHTYATWSIAAGVGLFELARVMGTSLQQVDSTYGHMLPDSLDRARTALDAYVGQLSTAESAKR